MRNRFLLLAVLGILIASSIIWVNARRRQELDRLYAEASGDLRYYRTPTGSTEAVERIAAYHSARSKRMLIDIALGRSPYLVPGQTQTAAMRILAESNDPEVADELVKLLYPHIGFGSRIEAAAALQKLPCRQQCINSILHYLERVWWGEKNSEDNFIYPPKDNSPAEIKQEQQQLYRNLYSVLEKEHSETLKSLATTYGFGTDSPSPFALDLISRLNISEACDMLMESNRKIDRMPPQYFNAPRQELKAAIAARKCQ